MTDDKSTKLRAFLNYSQKKFHLKKVIKYPKQTHKNCVNFYKNILNVFKDIIELGTRGISQWWGRCLACIRFWVQYSDLPSTHNLNIGRSVFWMRTHYFEKIEKENSKMFFMK